MRLLLRTGVPAWADTNQFILTRYRPESRSWTHCLASWTYWPNETANIYSHPVLAVMLALGAVTVRIDLRGFDGAIVVLQLVMAILCLVISTLYHTALNHSASFDYGGILALILGNFLSGLHFGFYCDPALRSQYWSLVLALSAPFGLVLRPWFRATEWRTLRLASCVANGLSAFAPIGHAWYLWGRTYLMHIGVSYYLLEGALLLAGCYVWEVGVVDFPRRVPEPLFPGRLDIWGHSHTPWHVSVALSIAAHARGLLSARDYNYRHALCRMG
ncbi:hypothetical protein NUU61_007508 [Penicillium alfredii]|uniref:Uncharacterized protein n=1 Tax=Penicillium alfredii TaxID=1506179 RepID=A0A9W9K4B4_9EURO|nr:uncharacterized protein NUU61_007508 [Penicillium alfredii]KAJ5092638.1 hypothetical protein NUU61_007508 [Penicillium alfredii]